MGKIDKKKDQSLDEMIDNLTVDQVRQILKDVLSTIRKENK